MLLIVSWQTSNFDFRHAEEIDIGLARALCTRITYVGELGYELFIPVEQATHVYDIIVEAGKQIGLQHAGLKALGSLRMVSVSEVLGCSHDRTSSDHYSSYRFCRKRDIEIMDTISITLIQFLKQVYRLLVILTSRRDS